MGKWCLYASSFIFDWIITKVAGNQNRHNGYYGPFICFLKWYLTMAHWTQLSDRCPLGYILANSPAVIDWLYIFHITHLMVMTDLSSKSCKMLSFWYFLLNNKTRYYESCTLIFMWSKKRKKKSASYKYLGARNFSMLSCSFPTHIYMYFQRWKGAVD